MKKPYLMTKLRLLTLASLAFAGAHAAGDTIALPRNVDQKSYQVILLRHGESMMNTQRRTSGWGDTHLSENGVAAGLKVGKLLTAEGIVLDEVYSSRLSRAIRTAWLTLEGMDRMWVPVRTDWRLNETNQGAFEGKTRAEQVAEYGEDKVKEWEDSLDFRPPEMAKDDSRNPTNDPRYSGFPVPQTESMADTLARIRAYWQEELIPVVRSGKTIMVVGHSNALRALSKSIDDTLEEKTLKKMDIPNTMPIIYTLDADMKPIARRVLGAPAN